jgi:hypothetical protein
VKSNVEEWKAQREVDKLNFRADRAEDYAATATYVAIAAMEDAEESTLAAIAARQDAEAAAKGAAK